jgi:hypothetical protein
VEGADYGEYDRDAKQLAQEGSLPVQRVPQVEEVYHVGAKAQQEWCQGGCRPRLTHLDAIDLYAVNIFATSARNVRAFFM